MNNCNNIAFHSVISAIQKVALYETKTRLLLVGTNDRETRFRVLEIDRTHHIDLKFHEDQNEYDAKGIRKVVSALGHCKKISAYGVLGFISFMESYYLILVTARTKSAVIGMHIIYTIKDTVMIRVCEPSTKMTHPLEQRYLRIFNNIDLNSNFYFSYSYDLTRTLQHNLSAPRFIGKANIETEDPLPDWNDYRKNDPKDRVEFAFRSVPRKRFVWNAFLQKPMAAVLNRDWLLNIVHGFVSQSNVSIFGRPVHVCLIARRSTRFAGTRFLKRGANCTGDVANEVESEQIVVDGHRMCSFVQMRGSIPSHWSQDISKMVPKPPISLDISDPYAITPGKHYERLLFQFGAPIIVLNLVKKREKRRHESILTEDMTASINYLNQFLPVQHRIKYHHFDMAKKSHGGNVMSSLAKFAENVVQKTGLFFKDTNAITFQTGIVRVNCVDCLDRTNTAQFAIGKSALAHQLHQMGFIKPPKLEFDSDCVTMLESLYEDHGDTLALQYGGSQLVHRIKTYRKTAAWTAQGNDFMQTLSRYYSNTFSDTEKQHSINVFLGYFIPRENTKENIPIWDLPTDYYMHNSQEDIDADEAIRALKPLTEWVNPFILKHLPHSTACANKIVDELICVHTRDLEMIDFYSNYHIPYKCTTFEEHIAFQISHLARSFMPTFRTNFSPFEPAARRREGRGILKNPSLTGQSSTGSANSSSSSMAEDSSSEDDSILENINQPTSLPSASQTPNPDRSIALVASMKDVYHTELKPPNKFDMVKYKRYAKIGKVLMVTPTTVVNLNVQKPLLNRSKREVILTPLHCYSEDNYKYIDAPHVPSKSIKIYEKYTEIPDAVYNRSPSVTDLNVITKYIQNH